MVSPSVTALSQQAKHFSPSSTYCCTSEHQTDCFVSVSEACRTSVSTTGHEWGWLVRTGRLPRRTTERNCLQRGRLQRRVGSCTCAVLAYLTEPDFASRSHLQARMGGADGTHASTRNVLSSLVSTYIDCYSWKNYAAHAQRGPLTICRKSTSSSRGRTRQRTRSVL